MQSVKEAATQFLAHKRIAVTGVSRNPAGHGSNLVYKRLRERGYQVFAVNPNAGEIDGQPCYPDLRSIPGGVEAVVAATHPKATDRIVDECAALGIKYVWMHRSFGQGSVSKDAVRSGRERGLTVIDGACPMMFVKPDVAHRCIRWILRVTGGLPAQA